MMQYSEYRSVSSIKNMMIIINFIIILFEASIILFSTKYVCNNLMGRDFLDTLAYLPTVSYTHLDVYKRQSVC